MQDSSYFTELTEAIGRAWNRFWFTPADTLPCCILRIATGAIATAHLLSLSPDLGRWYSRDGLLPPGAVSTLLGLLSGGDTTNYHYSYLGVFPAGTELWVVHIAAIAVAIAFMVGLFTRLSGLLTLVAVLAYVHRVPFVAGDLEPVLVFLLAYLIIAPAGAYVSVDRWLSQLRTKNARAEARQPSVTANIALRLIQVHTAMFVAMMGLSKLYGDAWWGGGAIWVLLAQTESRPLDLTGIRRAGQLGEFFLNFWAHAVVYIELAFPIVIWNRLARPLVLALAATVWLSLALATGSLLLALALIAASASFVPAEFYR
jgi:uncharacterized membrane protein YphA (DoxX/SURF4 family)